MKFSATGILFRILSGILSEILSEILSDSFGFFRLLGDDEVLCDGDPIQDSFRDSFLRFFWILWILEIRLEIRGDGDPLQDSFRDSFLRFFRILSDSLDSLDLFVAC